MVFFVPILLISGSMKILFTRFPLESAIKGGAELQTISLMKGLLQRGHEVAFTGSCPALLSLCRELGIPTVEWDIGPPPVTKWHSISFFWRKRHMRQSLRQLMDTFFKEGPGVDVVVMLSLTGKLLLTDIVTDLGARAFWIEHDRVGNWLLKNPWLRTLIHQSRKATTIVVSELSHRIYRKLGWHEDDLLVIPNGVDTERLHTNKLETSNQQPVTHMLRIACIARLSPEKGVDLLVEAVASLAGVHLEIVGEGREAEKLKMLTRMSNTTDMVTFTPFVEQVTDVYSRMDVLVLPSRDHDPFGLAAAEAMMLGIPVIVTDQCGIAGYLTNETDALVVPANSPLALKEAIEKMQKPLLRDAIGKAGQKTAERVFSLERMIDAYETAFGA